jgi:tight adherence protein C
MNILLAIVLTLSVCLALVGARVVQTGVASYRHRRAVDQRIAMFATATADDTDEKRGRFESAVLGLARLSLLFSKDLQAQARQIRAAGFFAHGAVNRFLALRISLSVIGIVLGPTLSSAVGCPPALAAAFSCALVFAGYSGPALFLRYVGHLRRNRIFRELPLFLDSVKLLLQNGASLELALRQLARMEIAGIPEIRRTMAYLLEDLDQGKSYDVAFERWVEKLAIPEAEEFAGLMLQSIMHGTELTPMLEQFIQDQIQQRLALAREMAGKRSVYLTIIMVAFFLPPLLAIIGAPAVMDIANTILN